MSQLEFEDIIPDDFLNSYAQSVLRELRALAPADAEITAVVKKLDSQKYSAWIKVRSTLAPFSSCQLAKDPISALVEAEDHVRRELDQWHALRDLAQTGYQRASTTAVGELNSRAA